MSLQLLTASRARDARSCRRLHYLKYTLGIRAILEIAALRFGTLMHRVLEVWWKGWQLPEERRLEVALAAIKTEDPYEAAKARVLTIAYHLRWKDEPLEPLGVEVKFETELRNPATGAASRTWRLAGQIDRIVRHTPTGNVFVMETKTSADDLSPGSPYFKRLRIDGQVSVYFEGARSLGHDVAGCIYDVLGKPAQRPSQVALTDERGEKIVLDAAGERVKTKTGKWRQTGDTELGYVLQTRLETPEEYEARLMAAVAEAPEKYLVRVDVVRLEQEMKDALLDVWQLAQELNDAERLGRRPKNPDACVRWGSTCPFFGACTGEASLEDPALFRRVEDVHPELSNAEPQEAVQ